MDCTVPPQRLVDARRHLAFLDRMVFLGCSLERRIGRQRLLGY
jgi:hypothetical protein